MKSKYCIAADIGTEWIDLAVADREKREVVGTYSVQNEQRRYGKDVLTRIEYCSGGAERLAEMQKALCISLREGVAKLQKECVTVPAFSGNQSSERTENLLRELGKSFGEIVLTGNTTMIYTLLGIDPSPIIKPPFDIPYHEWDIGENIFIFPCKENYLGGDILSAVYALQFDETEDGTAYFDIGVNSELVIRCGDRLLCGSCAAGPAYEAESVAADGTVTGASDGTATGFSDGVVTGSSDGTAAEVIDGAAMISFLSELCSKGALNRRGRLQKEKDSRIIEYQNPENGRKTAAVKIGDAYLTQAAIGNFLQSKASTATMIEYMCEKAGMETDELKKIIISGRFGQNIDLDDAVKIGMMPDTELQKYNTGNGTNIGNGTNTGNGIYCRQNEGYTGNAALDGAVKLLLADAPAAEKKVIRQLYDKIRYVQLKEVDDYLELMIPHLYL